LIQAGILTVIYPENTEIPDRWASDFKLSMDMFKEAGIELKTA
jgi:hypothetical protein